MPSTLGNVAVSGDNTVVIEQVQGDVYINSTHPGVTLPGESSDVYAPGQFGQTPLGETDLQNTLNDAGEKVTADIVQGVAEQWLTGAGIGIYLATQAIGQELFDFSVRSSIQATQNIPPYVPVGPDYQPDSVVEVSLEIVPLPGDTGPVTAPSSFILSKLGSNGGSLLAPGSAIDARDQTSWRARVPFKNLDQVIKLFSATSPQDEYILTPIVRFEETRTALPVSTVPQIPEEVDYSGADNPVSGITPFPGPTPGTGLPDLGGAGNLPFEGPVLTAPNPQNGIDLESSFDDPIDFGDETDCTRCTNSGDFLYRATHNCLDCLPKWG
jgi:hypothetical protein